VFEDRFEVLELAVMEWIHAFRTGELPALVPEFLDTAVVTVILGEKVA
jgi:hypothetical protein